jgi:hypothetical protein
MTPQRQAETDTAVDSPQPPYRQIQAAHEQYFQDLALAWAAVQSRFQMIQREFEREAERAWQAQDPEGYQAALARYQSAFQAVGADSNQSVPYNDAYSRYKAAMQKAFAGADVDDLCFADIAYIGQSLTTVWPIAMMLSQLGAGAIAAPLVSGEVGTEGGTESGTD